MIITEKHAMRLVSQGKAIIEGICRLIDNGPSIYAILTRYDKQRTDHFVIDEKRYEKLMKKWGEK